MKTVLGNTLPLDVAVSYPKTPGTLRLFNDKTEALSAPPGSHAEKANNAEDSNDSQHIFTAGICRQKITAGSFQGVCNCGLLLAGLIKLTIILAGGTGKGQGLGIKRQRK